MWDFTQEIEQPPPERKPIYIGRDAECALGHGRIHKCIYPDCNLCGISGFIDEKKDGDPNGRK